MPNYIMSRNERLYLHIQSAFGTAATIVAADAVQHIRLRMKPSVATLTRRDKTGTRTPSIGTKGREHGTWSLEASLVHGAAVDTVPDFDALYECAFGGAAVVSAATSVTYSLSDVLKSFTIAQYVGDGTGTPNHQLAWGCVPRRLTFTLGQDVAEFSAEGESGWVIGKKNFSAGSTVEKAGLGSFPTEPSSPTTTGTLIAGFTGSITLGGSAIADIRTATIVLDTGAEVVKNTFGFYTGTGIEADSRNVTLAFTIDNSDDAGLETLQQASRTKTPVDAVIQVGDQPGGIYTFTVKQVQLESPDLDDGSRRMAVNFPASRAFGTSISAKDEIGMVLT